MTAFSDTPEQGIHFYKMKNYKVALPLVKMGAEDGHADAQYALGLVYACGRGLEKSDSTAVNWFRKAAAQNHATAATELGFMYDRGRGVTQSYEEAVAWYRIGADGGNMYGMGNLGYMLYKGVGTPQDLTQAFLWTQKAAEKGHRNSIFRLGEMYELGTGVPQDNELALQWYQKAADLNAKGAQAKVDVLGLPARQAEAERARLELAALQTECTQTGNLQACKDVYSRIRGVEAEGFVIAEHICETWGLAEYCFEAGADLLLGVGATLGDSNRAYENFYSGCYKRHAQSCYHGGNLKLAGARGRQGFYDAMLLFDIACTNSGYRDSCALKRTAQRGGDAAVAAGNQRLRENHDDALRCEKTRIVGNGGRTHISYDCRTNMEWRLGKKR